MFLTLRTIMKERAEKYFPFILIFLLLLGTLLRFTYACQFRSTVFFNPVLMDRHDQKTFHLWAKQIQAHPWYVDGKVFYMAPLYPYFLALLYTISGDNIFFVLCFQLILDVLLCLFLYLLGTIIGGRKVGILAALFGCFYRTFIVYASTVLSDSLILFLYTAFILSLYSALRKPALVRWMLVGFLLGLSALAKPTIGIYLPFLLLGLLLQKSEALVPGNIRGKNLLVFLLVVAISGLVILPVTMRNLFVAGEFVPICSNGPVNWAIGNSSDSLGLFCYPRGRLLMPWSVDFWKLQLVKTILFFTSYEWPQNLNVYLIEEVLPTLKLGFVHFGLVVPIGLGGLVLMFSAWRKNFLFLSFTLSNIAWVIMFFVTDRYRLPAVACLMVSAAYCLVWSFSHLKSKWKIATVLWMGISLFAYFFNTTPGPRIPDVYLKIFASLTKKNVPYDLARNDWKKAYQEALTYVRLQPQSPDAHFLLACVFQQTGRQKEAVQALRKTLQLDPGFEAAKKFLEDLGESL